jgi:tripartite motif-containing protein 2/3
LNKKKEKSSRPCQRITSIVDVYQAMASSSPTPSLDSLPGATTNSSFGEPATDYLSDSPLTTGSGTSPPDSGICDDFLLTSNVNCDSTHPSLIASEAAANSLAAAIAQSVTVADSLYAPRCTGCKNKKSDAVAKCIDCVNYLCANCVTAHQYMHCFNGHSVFRFNHLTATSNTNTVDLLGSHKNMNTFDRLIPMGKDDSSSQIIKSMMNSIISPPTTLSNMCKNDNLNNCAPPSPPLSSTLSTMSNADSILANAGLSKSNRYYCSKHSNELLKFYCRTCSMAICKDCMVIDHQTGLHDCEHNPDQTPKMVESLLQLINDLRIKAQDMKQMFKNTEHNTTRIQIQYHKAQNEINETYQFYRSMLDERKQELLKELDSFYNAKTMSQSVLLTKSQEQIEKVLTSCECVEKFAKSVGPNELSTLRRIMETKLQTFMSSINDLQSIYELDFVSNYQAIQVGVRNTFGYIRSNSESVTGKQPPIARPTSTTLTNGSSPPSSNGSMNGIMTHNMLNNCHNNNSNGLGSTIERPFSNGGSSSNSAITSSSSPNQLHSHTFDTGSLLSKRFTSINSLGPFIGNDIIMNSQQQQQQQQQQQHSSSNNSMMNPYEKWSNGMSDNNNIFGNIADHQSYSSSMGPIVNGGNNNGMGGGGGGGGNGPNTIMTLNTLTSHGNSDSMLDLTNKLISTTIFPPKSQIKRQKMIYHCKFGEFGVMEGQFTEPSGVAVNAQNDIIVADTNNHRIQIFDKEGRFKFQFGECGKRDGQLLYPNRVAVVRTSGDIIVTERSPTHQIQIYNQYGQFVRKFGANILQHPRGVTVDNKGRIIVVECKVMRVIIFDQNGNVLQKFGCSKHLEFPNGVVVNDKQEIFISDNRAHCVKVFNYEGTFLRQIGGEGITNYPIGVGINANGEILIADNHNNFNLTIFTQDGQLVSALESKVKHAQCFDVALMDDGSVVLASKDYRLYIYRYVQVPPIGL